MNLKQLQFELERFTMLRLECIYFYIYYPKVEEQLSRFYKADMKALEDIIDSIQLFLSRLMEMNNADATILVPIFSFVRTCDYVELNDKKILTINRGYVQATTYNYGFYVKYNIPHYTGRNHPQNFYRTTGYFSNIQDMSITNILLDLELSSVLLHMDVVKKLCMIKTLRRVSFYEVRIAEPFDDNIVVMSNSIEYLSVDIHYAQQTLDIRFEAGSKLKEFRSNFIADLSFFRYLKKVKFSTSDYLSTSMLPQNIGLFDCTYTDITVDAPVNIYNLKLFGCKGQLSKLVGRATYSAVFDRCKSERITFNGYTYSRLHNLAVISRNGDKVIDLYLENMPALRSLLLSNINYTLSDCHTSSSLTRLYIKNSRCIAKSYLFQLFKFNNIYDVCTFPNLRELIIDYDALSKTVIRKIASQPKLRYTRILTDYRSLSDIARSELSVIPGFVSIHKVYEPRVTTQ
jgi:hypothetical protein